MARVGVGDRRRLGEDRLHARIRLERLALLDADRGEEPHHFRFDDVVRLVCTASLSIS